MIVLSSRVDQPPVSGVPVAGATREFGQLSMNYISVELKIINRKTYRQDPVYRYQLRGKQGFRYQHAHESS